MNQATGIEQRTIEQPQSRRKTAVVISIAAFAFVLLILLVFGTLFPPSVKISIENDSRGVPVDTELRITASSFRGTIDSVEVKQTTLDPLGAPTGDRIVEGQLENGVFVAADESNLSPDSRYDVTVNAELRKLSFSGFETERVTEHLTFYTLITPAPLFSETSQLVEVGDPIVVEFNTPIDDFSYTLEPPVQSSFTIDEENPTKVLISFEGYEQGQSYTLTVTGATAINGASLVEPRAQAIATSEPLKVIFIPGDGESAVSLGTRPTLTFSDDIRNPEMAESLLQVEPETPGSWEWIRADTLEFKPLSSWTQGTQITIKLLGGTEAFRGVSGSYLRQDVESTFTTKPSKMIDVDLTEQTVTLYDNDQLVRTIICSSGDEATPSLTGTYSVYAKAEKVDMEGEGYRAEDVPWVLMFNGDYTIHGNYWATTFGVPTSHGCVGLPVPEAEYLYNWAPIGTIVSIHY